MRIRKNAKLSSILPSHASTPPETLQTHVCQLNQSPWDVIPFSQDSCPSFNYQFEGEDSFTGNGSFGDSMGAVESVASMMDGEEKAVMLKVDEMVIDDDNGMKMEERVENVFDSNEGIKIDDEFGLDNDYKTPCCIKTDGKGWRCRNEPKNGHTLCDHHSSLLKKPDNKGMAASASSRRGGGRAHRAAKKGASSASNPYEFYYYSGFGPSWGKRRGDNRVTEGGKKCEVKYHPENSSQNDKTPSSSSQIDNDEFDFMDDDDEDDEDDENGDSNGRKRIRKPVKARSLKSLM